MKCNVCQSAGQLKFYIELTINWLALIQMWSLVCRVCDCISDVVLSACHMLLLDELCPLGLHIVWKYDITYLSSVASYTVTLYVGIYNK